MSSLVKYVMPLVLKFVHTASRRVLVLFTWRDVAFLFNEYSTTFGIPSRNYLLKNLKDDFPVVVRSEFFSGANWISRYLAVLWSGKAEP